MYGLIQTVAPTGEPVSRTEAKTHCKVEVTDDDTYIDDLITAWRDYVEQQTGRQLMTATWEMSFAVWPYGGEFPELDTIWLPKPPVSAVNSITYLDGNGVRQTLDSSTYQVSTRNTHARVFPAYTSVWPANREQVDSIIVNFTAGYGAASAVPKLLRQAIKWLVAQSYRNREPASAVGQREIPFGVKSILRTYNTRRFR